MRFTWDERKNARNRAKHGVSFERATLVFRDPYVVSLLDDHDLEQRWLSMGLIDGAVVLVVVHTVRQQDNENEEEIRIISARKATRHEREVYAQSRPHSSSEE
jgi:uncharacterized protein